MKPIGSGSDAHDDAENSTRIIVTVCTHRRNQPLDRLLRALGRNLEFLPAGHLLGVVVVDDNDDGRARSVCDRFSGVFPLGLHYRHAGTGNISIARNIGLEVALEEGDWIAMTDDDCEPVDTWLSSYIEAQRATGSTALTGPCYLEPPTGSPRWLTEQPFLLDGQLRAPDRQPIEIAATHNSFICASFLRERPWLRFEPELGVIGGEDMAFFGQAHADGLDICFSSDAKVIGHETRERSTFRQQLRTRFWLGNTEYVTNEFLRGTARFRWLLISGRRLAGALARPVVQLLHGRGPQLRYATALGARALGNASGVLGVRVRHH